MRLLRLYENARVYLMIRVRTRYWRLVLGSLGEGSAILGRVVLRSPERIHIGKNTTLNEGVFMNAAAPIAIGDWVSISPGAHLNTTGLVYEGRARSARGHESKPIRVGSGAWISSGAFVAAGVSVGEDAIVAAGAVVLEDVPPGVVVGGVPARVLKRLALPREEH